MANSTLAIINSKNRLLESISSSNFTYNIGTAIEIQELALKSVSLPNTAYNINNYNNLLRINYNGFVIAIFVPAGQYTINELIIKMTSLFLLQGVSVLITQDPISFRLVYTFAQPSFIFIDAIPNLSYYVGFNVKQVSQYPAIPSLIIDAPTLPNLQGTNNYYIASRTLGQGVNALLFNAVQNLAIIAVIPNTVPYGSIIQYIPTDILLDLKLYSSKQNIQQIDIIILDTNFNVVDLNGSDVELCFKCYLKSRVEVFGK
jgi:hypothetical protein